ncbi:tyrosine-type recombinase/integrase [Actinorugispora endophytica]|uniref:Site-specific recombinase XerD n=1 Tax=Actinorugispora endophytica TaxID=1605990 RepID=A0A4R6URQ6_9ACTN|nr:site-specific integrase [Actinorugispora endophytica]TDQ45994.1 site-specific recombinase XerD [Actinorugispora endophytica]
MARVKDLWKNRDGSRTSRYGSGKRYLAVWEGPDGKEKTRAFERKIDASRHGSAMETDRLRGSYIDPRAGRISVRTYAESRWFPLLVHISENTRDTYGRHLRNRIYPAFGEREIGSLTRADMKHFVAVMDKDPELSPSTVHTAFATLRIMMQAAVDDEIIIANPCSRVKLPRITERVIDPLSPDAVLGLADVLSPRYRVAVFLGAGAGLRRGEALGLVVPRVDFLKRSIDVRVQAQKGKLVDLKTRYSKRVVPVDDLILEEIRRHMLRYEPGPEKVLISNTWKAIAKPSSFNSCWAKAVEKAGLPTGTRFHDLRHFYASSLIAAGVNAKAIQRRMGHASITETFDTYGHLFPDHEDLGRGAIGAMLTRFDEDSGTDPEQGN